MLALSSMARGTEKELWSIGIRDSMRAFGRKTCGMERDLKDTPMAIRIMGNLSMVRLMEREFILGKIERFMMVNGIKDWRKDMAFGKEVIMIAILVNGLVRKHMVTVYILGRMEIDMKDSGECAWNTDKDMTLFAMEIRISVSMLMENLMEKENIFGLPDKFIQGIFLKE